MISFKQKSKINSIKTSQAQAFWLMKGLDLETHCYICGALITMSNIGKLFKTDSIHILCDSPQCTMELEDKL